MDAKRLFDILAVVSGIARISPVLAGAAIDVLLPLETPLLFKQKHLGLHSVPFILYKFRMTTNAVARDQYSGDNGLAGVASRRYQPKGGSNS